VFVGYQTGSEGTLTIAGGANIFSSVLDIGASAGATGTVWMTGGQLIATNGGAVYVSEGGDGQLTISNGTFLASYLVFGDPNTARGTLTVAGGTVTILNDLSVGDGTQTVWLTSGQLNVTNGTTTIGNYGVGSVTVSNGLWKAHDVIMGVVPGSQGTLMVAGGVSSVYSNVSIGNTSCSAAGFVFVTGGELHVTNDDATGVLEVRDGTLIQTGGLLDIDRLVITNACAHFMHLGGTLIIGLETLSPNLDADGDGIPNGYELANGLDPLNPGDASMDNDGDGMSNLQEYLAGTDPNNNASYFHIVSAAREGNNVRITWTTVGGRTNQVYLNPPSPGGGITDGISPLGPLFIIPGAGESTTNYLDVGGATNKPSRYYRVRLVP
jgi:T5SS/PEP-CTERM-associated repeat protein